MRISYTILYTLVGIVMIEYWASLTFAEKHQQHRRQQRNSSKFNPE